MRRKVGFNFYSVTYLVRVPQCHLPAENPAWIRQLTPKDYSIVSNLQIKLLFCVSLLLLNPSWRQFSHFSKWRRGKSTKVALFPLPFQRRARDPSSNNSVIVSRSPSTFFVIMICSRIFVVVFSLLKQCFLLLRNMNLNRQTTYTTIKHVKKKYIYSKSGTRGLD